MGLEGQSRLDWLAHSGRSRLAQTVLVVLLPAALGVLAAIAIPAYQDYVVRSQVEAIARRVDNETLAISRYVFDRQQWPQEIVETRALRTVKSGIEGGLWASLRLDEFQNIVVTLHGEGLVDGRTLIWHADIQGGAKLRWTCSVVSLPSRYAPSRCRS